MEWFIFDVITEVVTLCSFIDLNMEFISEILNILLTYEHRKSPRK